LPEPVQSAIEDVITAAGDNGRGSATIVRIDGQPSVACVVHLDLQGIKNDGGRQNERARFRNDVRRHVEEVRAVHDEADVLAALQLASDRAGPGGTVVVIDSGLQTTNPLNFTVAGLLDAGAAYLADMVVEGNHLHDLTGRTVILAGIGETAPPQAPLYESQKQHLREIWEAIVRRAGASDVVVTPGSGTAEPLADVPSVSTVPVPDVGPIRPDCNAEVILYDDQIGFLPNSTDPPDPPRARELLEPVAAWLRSTSQGRAHLVGSVAHYGNPKDTTLSLARAERVKEILVELGVDGARITTEGIGWGPIPSVDAPPDPAIDHLNRRVVVHLRCDQG
jgi:outer membrane protein OmpA-like peptidoglycan-associated protein